jgi:1,4-alpha-glucan branching enzyme
MANEVIPHSLFSEFDVALFQSGKHFKLYEKFGSHELEVNGEKGVYFAVWAPNAKSVSVTGNFNFWDKEHHALFVRWDGSGIWEGFIPGLGNGETYKYVIQTYTGEQLEKGDPFAFRWEVAQRLLPLFIRPGMSGRISNGCRSVPLKIGWINPGRSMRYI